MSSTLPFSSSPPDLLAIATKGSEGSQTVDASNSVAVVEDDDDEHEQQHRAREDDDKLYLEPQTPKEREAIAYLLRYETMCRQQEAEEQSVLDHLRPLLRRLQQLSAKSKSPSGRKNNNKPRPIVIPNDEEGEEDDDAENVLKQTFTYAEIQRAVRQLSKQSSKKKSSSSSKSSSHSVQDEFMRTDQQLMLVLKTLVSKHSMSSEDPLQPQSITWAELIQCYKVVIGGMQTLQHLPSGSLARTRARDRSLSMLSLFEPPSSKLLEEGDDPIMTDVASRSSAATALSGPEAIVRSNRSAKGVMINSDLQKDKSSGSNFRSLWKALVLLLTFTSLTFAALAMYPDFHHLLLGLFGSSRSASAPSPSIMSGLSPSNRIAATTAALVPSLLLQQMKQQESEWQVPVSKLPSASPVFLQISSSTETSEANEISTNASTYPNAWLKRELTRTLAMTGVGVAFAPLVWQWVIPKLAGGIWTWISVALAPALLHFWISKKNDPVKVENAGATEGRPRTKKRQQKKRQMHRTADAL